MGAFGVALAHRRDLRDLKCVGAASIPFRFAFQNLGLGDRGESSRLVLSGQTLSTFAFDLFLFAGLVRLIRLVVLLNDSFVNAGIRDRENRDRGELSCENDASF